MKGIGSMLGPTQNLESPDMAETTNITILIIYFPLFLFRFMLASLKTNIGSPGIGLDLVIELDLVIVLDFVVVLDSVIVLVIVSVSVIVLGLVLELDYHLVTPARRITPVEFFALFWDNHHRITTTDHIVLFLDNHMDTPFRCNTTAEFIGPFFNNP